MSLTRMAPALLAALVLAASLSGTAQAAPGCFGSRPTIAGTAGDDLLVGTDGADVIYGGGGSDTIRGGKGNDRLCGGGIGFDDVAGGRGRDLIDVAGYDQDETKVQEHYASAAGGPGRDRIEASGFWTVVRGNAGADSIHGRGAHLLFGDSGDDSLVASERPSTFFQGGAGDDRMADRTGTGVLVHWEAPRGVKVDLSAGTATGWGRDTISGFAFVLGSDFDDVLLGSDAAESLDGGRGDDRLAGRGGNDRLSGYEGADRVFGGAGDDEASGTTGRNPQGMSATGAGHRGPGADIIYGGSKLYGGGGDDSVIGGSGDDVVYGGSGDDDLHGYAGDDQLFGGDGADYLSGYWSMRASDADRDLGDTDSLDGGSELDDCFAGERYINCEIID